jgi:hypothetical protein
VIVSVSSGCEASLELLCLVGCRYHSDLERTQLSHYLSLASLLLLCSWRVLRA